MHANSARADSYFRTNEFTHTSSVRADFFKTDEPNHSSGITAPNLLSRSESNRRCES